MYEILSYRIHNLIHKRGLEATFYQFRLIIVNKNLLLDETGTIYFMTFKNPNFSQNKLLHSQKMGFKDDEI